MEGRQPARYPNAFTMNKYGFGGFFPFSASGRKHVSIHTLDICAVALEDIRDIIEGDVAGVCLVYDVDHNIFSEQGDRVLDLVEAIHQVELDCRTYDSRMIAVKSTKLGELAKLLHFNLHLFDLRTEPDGDQASRLYAFATNFDFEQPILSKLHDSNIFVDVHDDCYLYLEAREPKVSKRIFGRTLQTYVAAVLGRRRSMQMAGVAEPPDSFVDRIYPTDSSITILRKETRVQRKKIMIGYSTTKFRFGGGDQAYPVVGIIEYDRSRGVWAISVL